ncbi:hypothetical protein LCGC14_1595140 [marine sediment metagenome]|uniref:PAS domain-containing protein n=1 Tax=marine sediment metagenome TaxID=412755 RepID=A0A0F9ICV2_9ZZZZ
MAKGDKSPLTEGALRRSEERFRRIFEHSNDAIFVIDGAHGEILEVNATACKMLGYSHAELLSIPISAVHPDEMPQLLKFTDSVVESGSGWTDELTCLTKSGEKLPAEISASVFELGGRRCVLAMVRNISARKRAEKALRKNEERAEQEMRKQLELAAKVQRSLLPQPVRDDLIYVDVRYIPIQQVGGDYCQVRFVDRDTCYITICDVTGHGIGASALASRVSSEVRHLIFERLAPSEIVQSLNAFILEYFGDTQLFLSFIAARIELKARTLTYSGAGHPSPLLIHRASGRVQTLASQNMLIGVFENVLAEEPEHSVQLEQGDRLLFYTDGLIETADASGRHLGVDGLARIGSDAMKLDLFDMADHILGQIDSYRQEPVTDDKTLIVVEMR